MSVRSAQLLVLVLIAFGTTLCFTDLRFGRSAGCNGSFIGGNHIADSKNLSDVSATCFPPDPTALLLHVYDYEIPQDRKPNHTAMRAIDGMYALAIRRHNFREGTTYYISTHCEGVGVASHRFRRVVHQVEEFVAPLDRKHRYGEVSSPAEGVYHLASSPPSSRLISADAGLISRLISPHLASSPSS